jgi:CRISPR/Cas system CSM-associated protein Csm3 (group 7 of RAMP superfamily)
MSNIQNYKIEFLTYWHVGSGLSGGANADTLVLKNSDGFPFIPGKTIKGLFRHAALEIRSLNPKMISQEFLDGVFGTSDSEIIADNRFFSDLVLSKSFVDQLVSNSDFKQDSIFEIISSTRIDENGQAEDGSLRQMEVTVPLTLFGSIHHFKKDHENELNLCAKWIKQLGLNRTRGLGKCVISLINN